MTAYPAAGDYYKAVQAPSRVFTVPRLQAAQFVWDSLGPTLARGSSAVVFQASIEGRQQALRCYIRNDASSRGRYSALNNYLTGHRLAPYVSGTTWLDDAITVNRTTWPVLTMEWIDGRTLNEYVDFLVTGSNAAALATLAGNWRELVALLQRSEFGHGDLQHGNVMVDQDGQLRLVDFDGVWIPQLAGQSSPSEFGHPNYQHPGLRVWDRWVDTFSALVIYLSLTALGRDPALWVALYNSKNLLFAKNDFFPPFQTEVWKQLAALGDPQIDALTRRLKECCAPDWVSAGSLEALLDRSAPPRPAPVLPSTAAGQRWWEQPAGTSSRPPAPPGGGPSSSPPGPGALGGTGVPAGTGVPGGFRAPAGTGVRGGTGVPGSEVPGSRVPGRTGVPGGTGVPSGPGVPGRPAAPGSPAAAPGSPAAGPGGPAAPATRPPAAAPGTPSGGVTLPTPPPLSAPLGTAGTGPLPQLSQKMVPPGDTIWWALPGAAPGSPRTGSPGPGRPQPGPPQSGWPGSSQAGPGVPQAGPYGPVPPAPRGYAPYPGQAQSGQGPSFPAQPSPAPATRQQPGPLFGALALGVGLLLLIVGASASLPIVVIGGLVAGAWGIWRLVTASGNAPKPPSGPNQPPGRT